MALVALTLTVDVFDEDLAITAARKHAERTIGVGTAVETITDAVQMLLDPGGGADAYVGSLNEVGLQIENGHAELLSETAE